MKYRISKCRGSNRPIGRYLNAIIPMCFSLGPRLSELLVSEQNKKRIISSVTYIAFCSMSDNTETRMLLLGIIRI